jgi:YebC/PmpR family DNA-binding regulatory protein
MSGHSKWHNIKNKKAAVDKQKGKIFGAIGRQIRVAVKEGGSGDPNANPSLRLALEKARAANMPHGNVERAIEKGLGKSANGSTIEEVVYEGYGPGGVGVMVYTVTDNNNRTGAEVRGLFERHGGSLGGPGAAAYLFEIGAGGTEVKVKVPMQIQETALKASIAEFIDSLDELEDVEMVITNMVEATTEA